mgnify:CR=1 FL=1|jgi:hypothetical protein
MIKMDRAKLIKEIKSMGEDYRNGSELLKMMDYYGVSNLRSISDEQVEAYLEMIKKERR